LLIDGDLRRPRIAEAFGLNSAPGLSDILTGAAQPESTIVNTKQVPGLSILPSGRAEQDPAGLLTVEHMQDLLRTVKHKYDVIVVDSPPVIPFSDARLLALVSDAVIFVSRYGFTTRRAITRGAQLLEEVRAPMAGVVLNGIDLASADYHYYNYGFSRGVILSADYYTSQCLTRAKTPSAAAAQDQTNAVKDSSNNPEKPEKKDKSKGAHA